MKGSPPPDHHISIGMTIPIETLEWLLFEIYWSFLLEYGGKLPTMIVEGFKLTKPKDKGDEVCRHENQ